MQCFSCFDESPELEAEDQETLALLRSLHPEVDQAYELVQQFTEMLRTRTGEHLDAWLEKVRTSQNSSVAGLCRWRGTR
jgi:transposase